jgi:hypothetical protein
MGGNQSNTRATLRGIHRELAAEGKRTSQAQRRNAEDQRRNTKNTAELQRELATVTQERDAETNALVEWKHYEEQRQALTRGAR